MWLFKKRITPREALRNLEYQEVKLRTSYNSLLNKAVNAKKNNKHLEERVYTKAATKVAKARMQILQKIYEIKSGIVGDNVYKSLMEAAEVARMAGEVMMEADDMKLKEALEVFKEESEVKSIAGELLDDSLRAAGYKPEEIEALVEQEKNSMVMEEIRPTEAADSLRAKIERELRETEL